MKSIIITGASGFIGQFLTQKFLDNGYSVIGIDLKDSKFFDDNYKHIKCDLSESNNIDTLVNKLKDKNIHCVFHLAAKIKVDKSVSNPEKYYKNNVSALLNLLNVLIKIKVYNIVFSSTAAVYNIDTISDKSGIFKEEYAGNVNGLSVYGETKLIGENILKDYSKYGFKGYIFRFFNVGGRYPDHSSPCHLIDILIDNIHKGKEIKIFGNDYSTKDGTCIRDYIHVKDIVSAFESVVLNKFDHSKFKTYNLGSEKGYTVSEIVKETINCWQIYKTGKSDERENYPELGMTGYNIKMCDRRPGDMEITIANANSIKNEIGWSTKYELKDIILDSIKTYH